MTNIINPIPGALAKYFLACKVLVVVLSLPWPSTLPAAVMSLAAARQERSPVLPDIASRALWLAVLAYPLVFFGLVMLAQHVVAPRSRPAAVALGAAPLVIVVAVLFWLVKTA